MNVVGKGWMRRAWLALVLCSVATLPALAGKPSQVVIHGIGTTLGETPIVAKVPEGLEPGVYTLRTVETQTPLTATVFKDGDQTFLATVLPSLAVTGAVHFDIAAQPAAAPANSGVKLTATGDSVAVTIDSRPLMTYLAQAGPKPYYHPVHGPTGHPITRAFPMKDVEGEKRDHPHQRSFWFTHGKVNGIDFWSEMKGHGSIKETSRQILSAPPTLGQIKTTDDWLGPDGTLICKDERTVRVYDTEVARVIDFAIVIHALDKPVVFGDTKEGMFGVRMATTMDVNSKKGGKITNSEGLTDDAAWGKPASWVDYTGPVEGETVGIAILNHPSSFRYPTTWHVRTYGLFAANPFGWHDFGMKKSGDHTIEPGKSISFAYRVVLHRGDTAAAQLPAAFAGYATPPRVELIQK